MYAFHWFVSPRRVHQQRLWLEWCHRTEIDNVGKPLMLNMNKFDHQMLLLFMQNQNYLLVFCFCRQLP
ncbi:hypothetical protein HanIR_Chr09g0408631 [Helianthus annuus]|nr:hypothetical protein HanIR_Chr09g0408631 [Helianthus annuus]